MKPPRATPFPSETALSTAVQARIKGEWGGHARKVHGGPQQAAGEPDIDACIDGRAVKVELKQPGSKPTPRQYKALRDWQDAGALAGWVTTLVELDRLLNKLGDRSWLNPQLDVQPGELPPELPLYTG